MDNIVRLLVFIVKKTKFDEKNCFFALCQNQEWVPQTANITYVYDSNPAAGTGFLAAKKIKVFSILHQDSFGADRRVGDAQVQFNLPIPDLRRRQSLHYRSGTGKARGQCYKTLFP